MINFSYKNIGVVINISVIYVLTDC